MLHPSLKHETASMLEPFPSTIERHVAQKKSTVRLDHPTDTKRRAGDGWREQGSLIRLARWPTAACSSSPSSPSRPPPPRPSPASRVQPDPPRHRPRGLRARVHRPRRARPHPRRAPLRALRRQVSTPVTQSNGQRPAPPAVRSLGCDSP